MDEKQQSRENCDSDKVKETAGSIEESTMSDLKRKRDALMINLESLYSEDVDEIGYSRKKPATEVTSQRDNISEVPVTSDDTEVLNSEVVVHNNSLQENETENVILCAQRSTAEQSEVGKNACSSVPVDCNIKTTINKQRNLSRNSYIKNLYTRSIGGHYDNRRYQNPLQFQYKFRGSSDMVEKMSHTGSLNHNKYRISSIDFDSTGKFLLSTGKSETIVLWDVAKRKRVHCVSGFSRQNFYQAKFVPHHGEQCVVASTGSALKLFTIGDGGFRCCDNVSVNCCSFWRFAIQHQRQGEFLFSCAGGIRHVDLRQPSTSRTVLQLEKRRAKINMYGVSCNPANDNEFITFGQECYVRSYDMRFMSRDGTPVGLYGANIKSTDFRSCISSAVYNHNGKEILISYVDEHIYLFDVATPGTEYIHVYRGHSNDSTNDELSFLRREARFFGPRSEFVVSGSNCGYIYIWDKNTEMITNWMHDKGDRTVCVEPHPHASMLASFGTQRSIKIWEPTGINGIFDYGDYLRVSTANQISVEKIRSKIYELDMFNKSVIARNILTDDEDEDRLPMREYGLKFRYLAGYRARPPLLRSTIVYDETIEVCSSSTAPADATNTT